MAKFKMLEREVKSKGMYVPSTNLKSLKEPVVVVDCSGSIGVDELNQLEREVK